MSAYKDYIVAYPRSPHLAEAKQKIDELQWKDVVAANTLSAYREYVAAYPEGQHVVEANECVARLHWEVAFTSRDRGRLEECLRLFPNSPNVEKARDLLWELDWSPEKLAQVRSVSIGTKGGSTNYGEAIFAMGHGVARYVEEVPNRLYVWRDFAPEEMKNAKRLGVEVGVAYFRTSAGDFLPVRRIDMQKTDGEICRDFGVSTTHP